ncbi:hypothetical protein ACHAXR_006223 [Thalassiosira sp. AJA248-18]
MGCSVCLQLVVAIGLLSLDCTAFAPAHPTADQFIRTPIIASSRIRPHHHALLSHSHSDDEAISTLFGNVAPQLQNSFTTLGMSAALFAAVLASPFNVHVSSNNINVPTISIERSQALALTENQQFVADVWFAVSAQFFDQSFNGLGEDGWRAKEKEAIQAVADTGPDDDEIVEGAIKTMLSALNDPYTRFLNKDRYETITAYATGSTTGGAGIGVQLLEDPRTKNVVVMATVSGGPAAAAGVRAGDVILKVDGESIEGASAEVVAAKCRGEAGGKVDVDFLRSSDNGKESIEHITLTRAKINANPIEASTFVSPGGKRVGLLKVPSFSTETVSQIVDGLRSVSGEGGKVDAIAIDMRGNVGGYMPAGVDAAKLFLPARSHIIAEVGKPGSPFKAYDADGIGADTSLPVYLLVDKRTASAAEIFTAALQDNKRALVVGTTNTFGKGRIQNVQPLENGSGVAVTRARYVTPTGRDIHGVGIVPNKEPSRCEMNDSAQTCLADILDM